MTIWRRPQESWHVYIVMSSLPMSEDTLTGLREGITHGCWLSRLLEMPLAWPVEEKHMWLPEVTK